VQQGWISLHRKIMEHPLYQEKRKFSRFEAWIDLLLLANHKDNKFLLGNELITVERGSFITSELKLMERWGWGKSKLRSFLEMLENDGMIVKKSDRKKTTITICNYCTYQGYEMENRPQTDHKQTDNGLITDTNNNDNNDNNENKNYYVEIIEFLNECASANYRHTTKKTRELINARMKEGFTVDDFKTVIEYCCREWKGKTFGNGELGDSYLRPSTLFNNKFDERLNKAKQNLKQNTQQETSTTYKPISFDFSKGEG
jgi:uncharacterized phage protein (TIGR02220 family)